MLCDECKLNQAVIEMNVMINGQQRHLHLCEECYAKMKNNFGMPSFFQGGASPFDDLFRSLIQPSMASGENKAQENGMNFDGLHGNNQHPGGRSGGRNGLLDQIGRNLTEAARQGKIDPVIGREREVQLVIETLNRRNKNNPVLIGEPGVGKTAIAEGLALKIVEGKVPAKLANKEIYLIDVSSLVAGTGIRGQFEQRMKQLMAELEKRKNCIVFIDEVHLLVGTGSAEGSSMDAGNILKPALARGELQIIGATTLNEYRKIEKDAALERRFQPIVVNEPTQEQAIQILKGIQSKYENYHHVHYTDDAIKACVTLSARYIQDRFLPDKAIDLMDESGSKVNLNLTPVDTESVKTKIAEIVKAKEDATKQEQFETAARLRDQEHAYKKQLEQLEKIKANGAELPVTGNGSVVDVELIQQIVEQRTGIPVRKLQADEQNKMRNLAEQLNAKVIGQKEAVEKVSRAIRRNRTGFRKSTRPIGSFLFVGPTGVGKTELAKTLAEEMFGERDAMIRIDMSEYMEKHSVSRLIGAPPGYVGHDEAGQLTEKIRRKPYSIILLDEIEKAHPDVMHIFLQILDDGRLTDSQGRTVSFKDTVIIMTSNAGIKNRSASVGFGASSDREDLIKQLEDYFQPEFLNRLDGIIKFNALKRDDLLEIVDLMLSDIRKAALEQGITLEVTDAAKKKLADLGFSPEFGARPLRRVLEEKVEDQISDLLLDHGEAKKMTVDEVEGKINVTAE
ncbi:ATP-dependent Clp protease ATP-binding subunit [Sporolactobacillus terrae]|uniref:ATP-dependent Clp protease ATP-binding subunit n=1 Tax=Sporolactobacillus terrae TaxID=269673 RepID=A0ABX5Q6C6_9BACL|nr:ATP-dependent Clp protease ATP-binding subunit [Sporolactobacillus terrae]QAA22197.1 ATP-dependent Clp protease ATP-binding subunit [Sporolactobacillus terrae]QAA25171.1 ATP-dependent Clp protease ATP-binding subunit [Sporolactobacillus terrae]UAK16991.1 ATP-dependent Clp protease ATP-binding subunit [Sporolactobacillus terrae]